MQVKYQDENGKVCTEVGTRLIRIDANWFAFYCSENPCRSITIWAENLVEIVD
jgi:hypothetical protein